jgi:hypothetical protein
MAAAELQEFFGSLSRRADPAEASPVERPTKTPRQGKGKGEGKRPTTKKAAARASEDREPDSLITMMARLCLRHEDQVGILKLDTSFLIYCHNPPAQEGQGSQPVQNMLDKLVAGAKGWQSRESLHRMPLRAVLAQLMFFSLGLQVEEAGREGAVKQMAISKGWLIPGTADQDPMWVFQKWDKTSEKLVRDEAKTPLKQAEVLERLRALYERCGDSQVVQRFHAARRLEAPYPALVTFLLDLGLREEQATQAHKFLVELTGCSALQLTGVQWKRSTLQRSPLAIRLAERLQGLEPQVF